MASSSVDIWNPKFLTLSPIFNSIRDVSEGFAQSTQWPTLNEFAAAFKQHNINNANNMAVTPVEQAYTPEKFDDYYESRIFLKGELQTRLNNWHDFFNATAWLQFPNIKAALNALHYQESKNREAGTNRSALENALALFDECGAIIVADDEKYLELIRHHQWLDIFCDNKSRWGKHIQCYVFGHAMHEKALASYIGMTTHSVLLTKPSHFFEQSYAQQLTEIDLEVATLWKNKTIQKTKDLQPFPLLGTPGWWPDNQDKDFYNNQDYFRKKRS